MYVFNFPTDLCCTLLLRYFLFDTTNSIQCLWTGGCVLLLHFLIKFDLFNATFRCPSLNLPRKLPSRVIWHRFRFAIQPEVLLYVPTYVHTYIFLNSRHVCVCCCVCLCVCEMDFIDSLTAVVLKSSTSTGFYDAVKSKSELISNWKRPRIKRDNFTNGARICCKLQQILWYYHIIELKWNKFHAKRVRNLDESPHP